MQGVLGPIGARLDANTRVVRGTAFTKPVTNTSTQADLYVGLPAGANVAFEGAAAEDFLEPGFKFDAGVDPSTVTGTAPAAPYVFTGKRISVVKRGIFPMIAAGVIAQGDEVNIADATGRVKTVSEAVGTLVFVIGKATRPTGAANDIVYVDIAPYIKKT